MRILAFTLLPLLFSCSVPDIQYPAGGLPYPENIAAKDSTFDIYQYRDSLSTYDSIQRANYSKIFLAEYNEPNLSIGPLSEITFRLIYDDWITQVVVITLTKNSITVKKRSKGHLFPYYDTESLSEADQEKLWLAERIFKMNSETKHRAYWIRYTDSLLQRYPGMDVPANYQALMDKSAKYDSIPFEYVKKTIPISRKTFIRLVKLINDSGFWTMPRESDCNNIPTDAAVFSLEANMADRYKIVGSVSCPDDRRQFTIACDEIMKFSGICNRVRLIWDGAVLPIDSTFPVHR